MLPPALIPRLRRSRLQPGDMPLPRPDTPVCVVGDVHGRADLLEILLDRIAAEPGAGAARIVFAGDLIDRGPASAAVLARVQGLVQAGRAAAVMGNHEAMLLEFLDASGEAGPRWLANGGDATLASFGLSPWTRGADGGGMAALAGGLRRAMPAGQEAWLRALPAFWRAEGLAVCHAGADPARAIEAQDRAVLLWGHRDFGRRPRADGIWIAHGHVIRPGVEARAGRIATDTGAFATGRLSAAWIDRDGVRAIEARI
jgi:serine/threonine protein phosphatase 1